MTTLTRRVVLASALGSLVAFAIASTALATHPRVSSGTPFRVPLVPAFNECTAPNSSHAPPIVRPSCNPPVATSDTLSTGANAGPGSGFVKMRVNCQPSGGSPPCGGADSLDITIDGNLTDVRCRVAGTPAGKCAGDLDYSGPVIFEIPMRITDHASGGTTCSVGTGAGCTTGTTEDYLLRFPVATAAGGCSDVPVVPNDGAGADCIIAAGTTVNTLIPGMMASLEGQRAVIAVTRDADPGPAEKNQGVRVLDAGPNGTVGASCPGPGCGDGDEEEYQSQGLFLP